MCDKAVSIYPSAIRFIPNLFKTEEMSDIAVVTCPFELDSVFDWYMFQELYDKVVSEDSFYLKTLSW